MPILRFVRHSLGQFLILLLILAWIPTFKVLLAMVRFWITVNDAIASAEE